MFIAIEPSQYNKENIIFADKIKNNIVENGFFRRIYYSNHYYSSNGIIIYFDLKHITIENYFNKIKCHFNYKLNQSSIQKIIEIERSILDLLNLPKNKTQNFIGIQFFLKNPNSSKGRNQGPQSRT